MASSHFPQKQEYVSFGEKSQGNDFTGMLNPNPHSQDFVPIPQHLRSAVRDAPPAQAEPAYFEPRTAHLPYPRPQEQGSAAKSKSIADLHGTESEDTLFDDHASHEPTQSTRLEQPSRMTPHEAIQPGAATARSNYMPLPSAASEAEQQWHRGIPPPFLPPHLPLPPTLGQGASRPSGPPHADREHLNLNEGPADSGRGGPGEGLQKSGPREREGGRVAAAEERAREAEGAVALLQRELRAVHEQGGLHA